MPKSKTPPPARIAAIYARYSSSAQNDASIEQQVAECRQYADDNRMTVVAVYEDRAISGRSDKRPGFQKMLRAAERGEFQVLIAYKSNRISRNMQSALTYEQKLSDAGVRVVYCKEEFGDNATGRFMLRTMMNMNQFYSENMSEDIRRGMIDSARKGKVTGSIPYGYKKGDDRTYQIDEPAAGTVREIYSRYLAGETLADIRRDFNARGLRTKRGQPWGKNSFHVILTNAKYTGTVTFGDITVEGAIPAIIDSATFAQAQAKMEGERTVRKRHNGNDDYILTGKLFCGYCFAPMVGMSGRNRHGKYYHYYACQTRRTTNACRKENVQKDLIELEVTRAVQTSVLDNETVAWIADSIVEASRRFREESNLAQYESQLRDVKKQIANVIRAIEMGVAGSEVKERMDELQEEKQTLQSLIAVEKIAVKDYDRTSIIGYLESIRNHDPSDKGFQKTIVRDFIRSVYLYDDKIKIIVDFTGKDNAITIPLPAESATSTDSIFLKGFAQRLIGCTITALGEPLNQQNSIEFTAQGFVITWFFKTK